MTYLIDYSDGSSIIPKSIHLSIDDLARLLASSGIVSRKRVIDHAYNLPRLYTVAEGKNHTLISVKAVESLLRSIATEVEAKDRKAFDTVVTPIAATCAKLTAEAHRLTCADVIGLLNRIH